MCTSIVEIAAAEGSGKGAGGWFDLTNSVVSYDHPHHAWFEEAISIDFVNTTLGPGARVAVEISLQSARDLAGALQRVIAAVDAAENAQP